MRIGAHMSVAGGFNKAVDRAVEIGANSLQIFSSPPQRWSSSNISPKEGEDFRLYAQAKDVLPVFVHGTYLINLASQSLENVERSKESLIADLNFCHLTGATGVIFHFGSIEGGWSARREYITIVIQDILSKSPEDTYFIIENAAGNGFKIGTTLEELAAIKKDVGHSRIKFCIDTAHALAGGYEFRTADSAQQFSEKVETTIGWDNVVAIHLNDSKVDLGRKRDLHQNIGEGFIGDDGFYSFLSHVPTTIPLLLETPGEHDEGPNKENIERVQKIIGLIRV